MIFNHLNLGKGLLLNPGGNNEIEALQTDVMRFMAILGFCLMFIFALVQTLPAPKAEPKIKVDKPMDKPTPPVQPRTIVPKPLPVPEPVENTGPVRKIGFSLIFETDEALSQLVRDQKLTFYAIIGRNASALWINGNQLGFSNQPLPSLFYEMEEKTVPLRFKGEFKKNAAAFGSQDITWGVTLPETTRTGINDIMATHKGGVLVISGNGTIEIK